GAPAAAAGGRAAEARGPARRRQGAGAARAPPTLAALVNQWRELRRALEGLRQSVPSAWEVGLDEEATAQHLADGRWRPVYRPVLERRWSLTLVVDDNWTMAIWQGLVPRLVALLERLGVFHDVRVYFLNTDADDATALRLRGSRASATGFAPARLLEPSGRRIIWVLTDGMGTAWRRGLAGPVLWSWARRLPVAVLGAVPRSTLRHTGLDEYQGLGPSPVDGADGAIAVPMLDPHPAAVARWAGRLTADDPDRGDLPAMVVWPSPRPWDEPARGSQPDGVAQASARRQVDQFRSAASPAAFELATRLAAAPITRSTLRLLLGMVEGPRGHALGALAELFAHGLLYPAAGDLADETAIAYDFAPGLRGHLLAYTRRWETIRVLQAVSADLGPRVDAVRHLGGALADPDAAPIPAVTPESEDFVAVEATAFGALSGRYLPRARRLQDALWQGLAHRQSARPPAIRGNIPVRNPHFTGRAEILANLRAALEEGSVDLPVVLQGMGGVGKSQLAIEYVHRYGREFDLVWWIPAERGAQVAASLVELAGRLNLPVSAEADVAVPAVLDALRPGQPYANWLLVFDNADEPQTIAQYLPRNDPGHILVTSRNPKWSSLVRPIEVNVFMREESVELLRRRSSELTAEDADQLANALGDLPLAVDQAAAWIVETGMAAGDYLRLLEDKLAELLDTSPPVDGSPVQAAWNVSLDRLASAHPAALRLLQVWSFYAPKQISRKILRGARAVTAVPDLDTALRDPAELADAVRQINRYALARVVYETDSYQMHRLVQAVIQTRMTDDERAMMRRAAHQLLAVNDPGDPDDPLTWRTYADLYPHLLASDAVDSDDPQVRDLVVNEIFYLYRFGDHRSGLELAEHAHGTWTRSLGGAAPETLRVAGWLGRLYFAVGRYSEAAGINAGVLDLSNRVNGPDHPETLRAIGNCFTDHMVAGDFGNALELARERLSRAEFGHGSEHVDTLIAAHDVAVGLRLVGRFAQARALDQATWRRKSALFGERSLEALRTLGSLAIDQRELGDYPGAVTRCEELVGLLERTVEGRHDHFQVLEAQGLRAAALRKTGRYDEALAVSARVWAEADRRYGASHPHAIAASVAHAIDLRDAGRLDEARAICEEGVSRYVDVLGDDHPYTLAASVQFAVLRRRMGTPERALDLNMAALAGLRSRLGDDHPWVLAAAANLASDRQALGRLVLAHELGAATYERSRRVLGDNHPSTLLVGANVAIDLRELGRLDESVRLLGRTTHRLRYVLGADHPVTRNVTAGIRADCDIDPQPL
ncbi:tetratricopeptide repeat protein, partial [Frankia sp. CNm7]|uniref:FxSxx-COOH system tetratricopeptide repeat protein n=1 Tax=Frankia nepalensis TaxID=1836974 RepID=UPI0019349CA1